jgi:hypothetical protein
MGKPNENGHIQSVFVKQSRRIYASVSIAAQYFADKMYQAVSWRRE